MEVEGRPEYKNIELFEIPRPEVPYLIIEPKMQTVRGLHVVSLATRQIAKLGRAHDTDIRISDISVSRLHAFIRFIASKDGGYFVLEDHDSKFGSLVEIRKPMRLESGMRLSIQVGRSVVGFSLKRQWRFIPGCFKDPKTSDDIVISEHPNPMLLTVPLDIGDNHNDTERVISHTFNVDDVSRTRDEATSWSVPRPIAIITRDEQADGMPPVTPITDRHTTIPNGSTSPQHE